ncbi:MAG TPA: hypothetical protein EYP28_05795 [Methanophagales archaeon]|nr:hypothetical protein [Methanophagales archaeon]
MGLILAVILIGEWGNELSFRQGHWWESAIEEKDYKFYFLASNDKLKDLKGDMTNATIDTTSRKPSIWESLGFGIGYSGGVCYTGSDLKRHAEFMEATLFDWLYWLNTIEATITYHLSKRWEIEIGGGYGWARMEDRRIGYYNERWEVEIVPITLNMVFKKAIRSDKYFFKFGGSFYFSRCNDIEKIYETDPNEPWKHIFIGYETIKGSGNGLKFSFTIGREWHLTSFVTSSVSTGLNIGQIGYNSETMKKWFPVVLNMTGIFIRLNLKIKRGGR